MSKIVWWLLSFEGEGSGLGTEPVASFRLGIRASKRPATADLLAIRKWSYNYGKLLTLTGLTTCTGTPSVTNGLPFTCAMFTGMILSGAPCA